VPVLNVSDGDVVIHERTRIGRILPLEETDIAELQERGVYDQSAEAITVGVTSNMPELSKLLPGEIDETGAEIVPVVAEIEEASKARLSSCEQHRSSN
jgi:hypothetical protein